MPPTDAPHDLARELLRLAEVLDRWGHLDARPESNPPEYFWGQARLIRQVAAALEAKAVADREALAEAIWDGVHRVSLFSDMWGKQTPEDRAECDRLTDMLLASGAGRQVHVPTREEIIGAIRGEWDHARGHGRKFEILANAVLALMVGHSGG